MYKINATHDPSLLSWVESANAADGDFPIQNLPVGVFDDGRGARGGVALGDRIIDVAALVGGGAFEGLALQAARLAMGSQLNALMNAPAQSLSAFRASLSRHYCNRGAGRRTVLADTLVPMASARMLLPAKVEAFTDFAASIDHVRRMGASSGQPMRAAWTHLPVAYTGRSGSVAVSGTPVTRPSGQFPWPPGSDNIDFAPEKRMDFELEFGAWLGRSSQLGKRVSISDAASYLFGCCLVNDWSARSIQFFESALGPNLGKSFLTTVSPWIVTMEALTPFRVGARPRYGDEPAVAGHLSSSLDQSKGALSVSLTADIQTERMRSAGLSPQRIVSTRLETLYWTLAQMLAHQSSNGSPLLAGELVATGTVSGPSDVARACLAEVNGSGAPLDLASGETRGWLEDGDEIVLRGRAQAPGFVDIGFGECRGRVVAG